jgi:hypothetical protein
MKRVSDKTSREGALQPGPTKHGPDHGHWYILNRRSGVDLHEVAEGRSYQYHNPAARGADKHPLNGKSAYHDWRRR